MMQHVNTVLVAKTAPVATAATIAAMATGEVALFDQNKELIVDAVTAAAATAVYVGVKTAKTFSYTTPAGAAATTPEILFSKEIQARTVSSKEENVYSAVVEDVSVVDFAAATVTAGNRYVVRIVYKDLYEHAGQFTHTYEIVAVTGETATTLAAKFTAKINKHAGRRVLASDATGTLTLTALAKDDNEGLESINKYTRVSMTAVAYTGVLNVSNHLEIPGISITNTAGTDGLGNPKIVRDREQEARGYKTFNSRTHFPVILPDLLTDLTETYDELTIEFDNKYLSPDNQYVKTTPLATEVYIPTTELALSEFKTNLDAFLDAKGYASI